MTKKGLTKQDIELAISALEMRIDSTRDLLRHLQPGGKYYQITSHYTETMGIWPLDGNTTRYTGANFWRDRPNLSMALDAYSDTLITTTIDNPQFCQDLEAQIVMCDTIMAQLERELAKM
jgi:hypothetical protein